MTFQQPRKKQENMQFCYLFCFLRTSSLSGRHAFPDMSEKKEETARNEVYIRVFGKSNPIFYLNWLELVVCSVMDILPSFLKTVQPD